MCGITPLSQESACYHRECSMLASLRTDWGTVASSPLRVNRESPMGWADGVSKTRQAIYCLRAALSPQAPALSSVKLK